MVFFADVNDERCVHIEVDIIKTSQSGAVKGKTQCTSRQSLLSAAVQMVFSITKQSLNGKVFISQPTSFGFPKMEKIVKNGFVNESS